LITRRSARQDALDNTNEHLTTAGKVYSFSLLEALWRPSYCIPNAVMNAFRNKRTKPYNDPGASATSELRGGEALAGSLTRNTSYSANAIGFSVNLLFFMANSPSSSLPEFSSSAVFRKLGRGQTEQGVTLAYNFRS
jgi:hypothetical protein